MSAPLPPGALPPAHDAARFVARWACRPAYRPRLHFRERVPADGPLVVVANHSSFVEPQLLFGMLPRRCVFLVKSELFAGPLGPFLRALGQLPVRRGLPDRAPLLAAGRVLGAGGVVVIFPEGTRGDGTVHTAERGAAWLVRTSGAAVLPVACRGTWRPPGTRRRLRPSVDLLVGEPFDLAVGKGRTGLDAATERIRGTLADLVSELDSRRASRHWSTTDEAR